MPQAPPTRRAAPAEKIAQLNKGINLYTDPTLCTPDMWSAASNVFSGMYGFLQRARFATIVTSTQLNYVASGVPFTTLKFFAIPGLSNYLLADAAGKLWSFDSGASYAATQRLNPYIDPLGAGSSLLNGPWSREVLQNIVYEMNGQVKQAGRLANAATIEGWGLDAPDASPQVTIAAGTSANISAISRLNGIVTVTLATALTVPGGNGIGMVNVTEPNDTSFNGSFIVVSGSGTTTLTWNQLGQNTTPTAAGTVNTNILKAVGRSYAWAWENVNKIHVSAPSPSTQFILYNNQNGQIQLTEQGLIAVASSSTVVTGTGTAFTSAWVGRHLWITGLGDVGRIASVQSPTQLTLVTPIGPSSGGSNLVFQIFDPQATHVRLYETADGGATYFRVQRNAFNPNTPPNTPLSSGLLFFDNANAEPPNFPFTTEISQLYNVPPPIGSFVKEYQGSLLVFGVPGAVQTFFYSNTSLTSIGQQQESFAPLNQVTLPIQNAAINGMVEFPGALIIWSDKQDMFRLTGLLTDNTSAASTGQAQGSTIAALPYNLGCASPFAIALTPLGALWLTSNAEIFLYTDSYAPRNIGHPIQSILRSINPVNLKLARMTYYHMYNRNWVALAIPANGASVNNQVLLLDIDLLASNGSPSFFVFDMATSNPVWYPYSIACSALELMYETNGLVRLFTGAIDNVTDIDFQQGFGTEIAVNGSLTTHAWGNDHPFLISRPAFVRFVTNRDTSLLTSDGWSFGMNGIDDDVYRFENPLTLALTPGVNDTATLCGNPSLTQFGESFRFSQALFRLGGVNFMAGRRIQFTINFPSAAGADYRLREIQLGFGPEPPS